MVPRLVSGIQTVSDARPDTLERMAILQHRYVDAMRDALVAERSIGAYSSETHRRVQAVLDGAEQRIRLA